MFLIPIFQEMPQKPNLEQPISPAGYVAKNLTAAKNLRNRGAILFRF
ncbi:hypothetical protein ABIB66_006160 [Bradyrhizobium sp. F1.13.3]